MKTLQGLGPLGCCSSLGTEFRTTDACLWASEEGRVTDGRKKGRGQKSSIYKMSVSTAWREPVPRCQQLQTQAWAGTVSPRRPQSRVKAFLPSSLYKLVSTVAWRVNPKAGTERRSSGHGRGLGVRLTEAFQHGCLGQVSSDAPRPQGCNTPKPGVILNPTNGAP